MEGYTFSADPGEHSGAALSLTGSKRLIQCCLSRHPFQATSGEGDVTVVEVPEIYRGGQARPRDIIKLALNAGGWLVLNPAKVQKTPNPKQWKGQVSKACTARRVVKALSAEELQVLWAGLPPKFTPAQVLALIEDDAKFEHCIVNNLTDAVALNLWQLGRYR